MRTLAAFEKSEIPDDWRELMRLYMVRRTRGFIMQHNFRHWMSSPFTDESSLLESFTIRRGCQGTCCESGVFDEAFDFGTNGVSRSKRTESRPRQRALLNSALTPTRRKPER